MTHGRYRVWSGIHTTPSGPTQKIDREQKESKEEKEQRRHQREVTRVDREGCNQRLKERTAKMQELEIEDKENNIE